MVTRWRMLRRASPGCCARSTSERSSLTMSGCACQTRSKFEKPVPKSSIAIRKSRCWMRSMVRASAASSRTGCSITSSTTRVGGSEKCAQSSSIDSRCALPESSICGITLRNSQPWPGSCAAKLAACRQRVMRSSSGASPRVCAREREQRFRFQRGIARSLRAHQRLVADDAPVRDREYRLECRGQAHAAIVGGPAAGTVGYEQADEMV